MRKILAFFTFFLLTSPAFTQSSLSNDLVNLYEKKPNYTPTPFSFQNYSDKGSVNHLTGSFGINIEFYKIETPYFNLPIILNYNTNGVKLNDISNEVGIDWNLIAGGTITRVLNDVEDDRGASIGFYPKQPGEVNYYDLVPNEYLNVLWNFRPNFSYGSERGYVACLLGSHYINQFPKRYDPNHSVLSEIGCLAEIKRYEEVSYDSYLGPVKLDTEADYFRFNVGEQNFNFVFKRKDNNFYYSAGNGLVNTDTYFEAVSLDDIGIKIKAYFGGGSSFYIKHKNLGRSTGENSKAIAKFEITDKDGIMYVFDKFQYFDFDILQETIHDFNSSIQGKRVIQYKEYDTNVNTWYLTKIILPNNENINFSYIPNEYMFLRDIPREHDGEYLNNPYNLNPRKTPYSMNRLDTHFDGFSISEINYNNQKIKFSYSNDRLDYRTGGLDNYNSTPTTGLNLIKIELLNNNNLIRKFDLIKEFYANNDDGHEDNRMFLKKINDSQLSDSYVFNYYNPELANRNEVRYQDLFGYLLGYSNNTFPSFPKVYISPDDTNGNKISYEIPSNANYFEINGTNRIPNPLFTKSGTIDRVDFPTGGYLKVDFENNTYYDNRLLSKSSLGPGVRVKNLKYYDNDNSLKISKKYTYNKFDNNEFSSGELLYRPSYAYISNWAFNNEFDRAAYEYNTPSQLNIVDFDDRLTHQIKHTFENYYTKEKLQSQTALDTQGIYKKMIHFSNYPIGPTSDIFGREIMYKNVSEKIENIENINENTGQIRYYFKYTDNRGEVNSITGPSDETSIYTPGDISLSFGYFSPFFYINNDNVYIKSKSGFIERYGKEIYPFPERSFYRSLDDVSLGKLEKLEYLNSSNEIVFSEEYTYEFLKKKPVNNNNTLNNIQTNYLKTHQYRTDNPSQNFCQLYEYPRPTYYDANRHNFSGLYFFSKNQMRFNSKVVLKSKKVKNYFQNGLTFVENKTDYNYFDDSGNVSEKIESGSNLDENKIMYEYPYSESGEGWIDNLYNKNRISKPYLIKSYKNNNLLQVKEDEYSINENNLALLKNIRMHQAGAITNGLYEVRYEFKKYNSKGLPLEVSKKDGINTVYIYGYHESKIVAQIENISYSDIPNNLIVNIQTATDSAIYNETNVLNALNTLRNDSSLSNAMITTYTYKPLIGVSTITDQKGNKTTYEYDMFNRLKQVIDKDGNILRENQYHYKTQN